MDSDQVLEYFKDDSKELASLFNKHLDKKVYSSPSVIATIEKLELILDKYKVPPTKSQKILDEIIPYAIPNGVKACVRGNQFNRIVEKIIKSKIRRHKHIIFTKEVKHDLLHEKLDWMLYNSKSKKTLIGFNQIDLWSGGHQLNRGSKYVLDQNMHSRLSKRRIKLVNVIAASPKSLTCNSKAYKILSTGILRNRICTLNRLKAMVSSFIE